MIAMGGPDWEERFWHLTHDLVVGTLSGDTVAMIDEPRNTVADCIVAASTAVAMYRAVLERNPEGFA